MTVYILPHKKSLKGTSYVKQVARRLYMVKGVTEFQVREVPYKVRAQRVSLPVFTVLTGGGAEELWPGRCSSRCPRKGSLVSCDKAEQTTCGNTAVPLPGRGQVTDDVEDGCLSDATETSG